MDSSKQWHGGKGSGRRSTADDSTYGDNWDKIFGKKKPDIKVRKETPDHGKTQIHTDTSKVIPRHYKYKYKVEE
jgi:hypothetical protein